MGLGLGSVKRNVHDYSQNTSKLYVQSGKFSAEGSEHPQAMFKLSFGTTKMPAYANEIFVFLFVAKNMRMFTALISFI